METKLSVLLYVDTADEKEIHSCVSDLCERSGLPAELLQIVVLDPRGRTGGKRGGNALEGQIAGQYPACRVAACAVKGMHAAQAYNKGISMAEGDYVAFMPATSGISEGAYKALLCREDGDEPLLSLRPLYRGTEKVWRDYPAAPKTTGPKDAEKDSDDVQLVLQAFLIKKAFLGEDRLREELHEEAFPELVLRLLLKNEGRFFYNAEQTYYYSVLLEDSTKENDIAMNRWWYEASLEKFYLPFLDEMQARFPSGIPKWIQKCVYYLICVKFGSNHSGHNRKVLNRQETENFFALCCEAAAKIDDDVLLSAKMSGWWPIPNDLRMLFLRRKAGLAGLQTEFCVSEKKLLYRCKKDGEILSEFVLGDLSREAVEIHLINERNGSLEIDGFFRGAWYLDGQPFELYIETKDDPGRRIPVTRSEVYDLQLCFGIVYTRKYAFHAVVPVKKGSSRQFCFRLSCGGYEGRLQLRFASIHSRLSKSIENSYWMFDRGRYMLTRTGVWLQMWPCNPLRQLRREIRLLREFRDAKEDLSEEICFRLRYWLLRPYYSRKNIWITYDKLYKGGDNGEYMFRYCRKEGQECYYVINEDAGDTGRLQEEFGARIVHANSKRCRFLALNASVVLGTHSDSSAYLGLADKDQKYFKDLFHADIVCIQHGLSVQDISQFQNRVTTNVSLYCCASQFEIENIAKPVYGYEPQMLKLTGLARFDGLQSDERRIILITPTWRSTAVHVKGIGMTNNASRTFKDSAYYRIYNALINDETLIGCAKEYGYRIIFLLHPSMSAQIDDYDRNDYVELLQATGDMSYERILTESSLMVTDYSGIQFDFAYQKKPIVYYHPDELPPHYAEGGLVYEEMGFGPICRDHAELLAVLCRYIQDGCRMTQEYKERVDRFFGYHDYGNCRRIFQEVRKLQARLPESSKIGDL